MATHSFLPGTSQLSRHASSAGRAWHLFKSTVLLADDLALHVSASALQHLFLLTAIHHLPLCSELSTMISSWQQFEQQVSQEPHAAHLALAAEQLAPHLTTCLGTKGHAHPVSHQEISMPLLAPEALLPLLRIPLWPILPQAVGMALPLTHENGMQTWFPYFGSKGTPASSWFPDAYRLLSRYAWLWPAR